MCSDLQTQGSAAEQRRSWLAERGVSRPLNAGNGSGNALVTGKRLLGATDMAQRAHSCQTCHVRQPAALL